MKTASRYMLSLLIGTLVLYGLVVPETAAQFDRIRNTITKIESEVDRRTDKNKPVEKNDPATGNGANNSIPSNKNQSSDGRVNSNRRLVFSNQPIDPNGPANLKTEFTTGEHIYGLLILDRPLSEFVTEGRARDLSGLDVNRPVLRIEFQLDGNPIFDGTHSYVFSIDDRQNAWTKVPTDRHFFLDIAPEPRKQKTYGYGDLFFPRLSAVGRPTNKAKAGAQFYSHHLSKLQSGSHTIKVIITGKEQVVGEFRITGGDYAFYSRVADALETASSANAKMPESKWNDAAVENSVKAVYKRMVNETILKVVLINPSWFVQKNALGQILFRGVFAAIATKTPDGRCWLQREYFKQPYVGGTYGTTQHDGRSETRQVMPCENVAK